MFIQIGGVPGSGKTTIVKELEKVKGIPKKRIVGSDILCELARVKQSELRFLSEETREKLRPEMFRKLYEKMKSRPEILWLVDGHFCFYETEGRRFGKRHITFFDKEMMLGILVIEESPATIIERRKREKGERADRSIDSDRIKEELENERKTALETATVLVKPVAFIKNPEGCLQKTMQIVQATIAGWW